MEQGIGMTCFRSLKYEIRSEEKKKKIENALVEKLGKWKYSPDELTQVPDVLLKEVKPQWDNAIKFNKDISEKTLRQLMLSLNEKEVKESLKMNEKKITSEFNTCLILLKDIESMVKSNTTIWKNIYG